MAAQVSSVGPRPSLSAVDPRMTRPASGELAWAQGLARTLSRAENLAQEVRQQELGESAMEEGEYLQRQAECTGRRPRIDEPREQALAGQPSDR